ncbi:MAG: hypothetical protein E7327_07495 [Clostridiales bacterium]|nr:hypothetical protein [Clostridiales bacterium]
MQKRALPWELLGAVVGAGLASGREVAAFFGRYGWLGFAGVGAAAGMLLLLGSARMPCAWAGRWPERLWRVVLALLLIATGGAMLAASGEVAALALPLHGARWLGMGATVLLACLLARRTVSGLMRVSQAMLALLAGLLLLGLTLPPMRAAALTEASLPAALLKGAAYGGFNAALMFPVMADERSLGEEERRRALGTACCMAAALLAAGNALLLRHPALVGEALPFVRMTAAMGPAGYLLSAASLYFSILTTLTVCIRSSGGRAWPLVGIVLTALLGFSGVVDAVYPLLGGVCAAMLALMHLQQKITQACKQKT